MKAIAVLGSTGSIGSNTLDVIQRNPEKYRCIALAARKNVDLMFTQCQQHRPEYALMTDADAAKQLTEKLRAVDSTVQVLQGEEELCQLAALPETDYVMAAIVGAAGLASTLAAVAHGKRVLLANKEALVMAGDLFMHTVSANGAELLPVDSEHNALFQCLPPRWMQQPCIDQVKKLILTASGGPFRERPLTDFATITPAEACCHPNWNMGSKISVDSATMMNKGLELIEACYLFALPPAQIDILLHPQSIIHSLVAYRDGSLLAQMGKPDMRTPIAYALSYPERIDSGVDCLDLAEVAQLHFSIPDDYRFPCLPLARQALATGGNAPAILNAANEQAVSAFLQQRIRFDQLSCVVEHTLNTISIEAVENIPAVLSADARARLVSDRYISQIGR